MGNRELLALVYNLLQHWLCGKNPTEPDCDKWESERLKEEEGDALRLVTTLVFCCRPWFSVMFSLNMLYCFIFY
ncbi:hypothetical protein BRADI_5g02323v3 [Brachypodium distachyon]|uniref:Uncharacterized protein n=1 Tax=Brachypodium distachyon TaxID=15368 RepID=A0A2K2CF09_BRADI|nr:hypothetical protein BRADI_5g02323v3 [Brachypodium distachyon]